MEVHKTKIVSRLLLVAIAISCVLPVGCKSNASRPMRGSGCSLTLSDIEKAAKSIVQKLVASPKFVELRDAECKRANTSQFVILALPMRNLTDDPRFNRDMELLTYQFEDSFIEQGIVFRGESNLATNRTDSDDGSAQTIGLKLKAMAGLEICLAQKQTANKTGDSATCEITITAKLLSNTSGTIAKNYYVISK